MVTICQQCGDQGFCEALICCDECQSCGLHLYCLSVLPKSFDDHVIWLCEDCESKRMQTSTLERSSPLVVRESCFESLKTVQPNKVNPSKRFKQKCKRINFSSQSCSKNGDKDYKLGDKNQICEFSYGEANQSFESKSSIPAFQDFQKLDVEYCDNGDNNQKLTRSGSEIPSIQVKDSFNAKNSQTYICCSQPLQVNHSDGGKDKKLGRQGRLDSCTFSKAVESHQSDNSQLTNCDLWSPESDERGNGVNICKHGELDEIESFDKEADSLETKKMQLSTFDLQPSDIDKAESHKTESNRLAFLVEEQSCYVFAQPIKDPIWRGKLSILHFKIATVGGLLGHLSTMACFRAYEEAKLLPESIPVELVSIASVWPKSFNKFGPTQESIALYFFPLYERDEKAFDGIVHHMIFEELAMRTVVKNAEMLIFTSNILPKEHWRFQTKFYLWSVFRRKQPSLPDVDAVPLEYKDSTNGITWRRRNPVSTLSNCSDSCN
ncbi:hypothetical protein K2173_026924 [Erythroxylum novogranatense]|uniref:AIPP2-like SPOC-like domain-containing protein n=1 Tax=Erythroxylum novogranatense TaxID=1862640 RepID=A0AAV8TXK1_9ROSI|nr:hypothetical protein K2173_026924 [Erythroxylum novogranatense]